MQYPPLGYVSLRHRGASTVLGSRHDTKHLRSRNKTVGAFLSRLKAGAVTEKEKNGWFEFISHNLMRCFSVMRDDVAFYTLALEQDWVTPDNIDEIMELSRSVECRAMVLERKRMNS